MQTHRKQILAVILVLASAIPVLAKKFTIADIPKPKIAPTIVVDFVGWMDYEVIEPGAAHEHSFAFSEPYINQELENNCGVLNGQIGCNLYFRWREKICKACGHWVREGEYTFQHLEPEKDAPKTEFDIVASSFTKK